MLFPLLSFLTLLCLASARSNHRKPKEDVDFECPFKNRHGEKCLRDLFVYVENYDKNPRPEFLCTNATHEQQISEEKCCYETECLEDCGVYNDVLRNTIARRLPESAFAPLKNHPKFFNVFYSQKRLEDWDDLSFRDREQWRIAMTHYSLALKEWKEIKEKAAQLDELFL